MSKELAEKTTQAFYQGLRSGVTMYAHWKDGVQYVGTTGKTLEKALAEIAADVDKIKNLSIQLSAF
jgi:hypothetical protein